MGILVPSRHFSTLCAPHASSLERKLESRWVVDIHFVFWEKSRNWRRANFSLKMIALPCYRRSDHNHIEMFNKNKFFTYFFSFLILDFLVEDVDFLREKIVNDN